MGRKKDPAGYSLGKEKSAKVAERLRSLLESTGMKQTELAKIAEVQPPHLSEILRADGTRNVQRWMVLGFARAFKKSEQELVGDLVDVDSEIRAPGGHRVSDPKDRVSIDQFLGALDAKQQRFRQLAKIFSARFPDSSLTPAEWTHTFEEIERMYAESGGGGPG